MLTDGSVWNTAANIQQACIGGLLGQDSGMGRSIVGKVRKLLVCNCIRMEECVICHAMEKSVICNRMGMWGQCDVEYVLALGLWVLGTGHWAVGNG